MKSIWLKAALIFAFASLLATLLGFELYKDRAWLGDRHSPVDPLSTLEEFIDPELGLHPRLRGLKYWQRPEGPWKVALQVGHLRAEEAPEEQINLRQTTGTRGGGMDEWEASLVLANETKALLEAQGIIVEILPTTIPPNYWADIFLSIHADGNHNTQVSGYKVAASRLDQTGKAEILAEFLDAEYGLATNLKRDPNITRSMRGYYAFNWRRYEHSIHPLAIGVIIETGFLTNALDRSVIIRNPKLAAEGIAEGLLHFLRSPEMSS